MNHPIVSIITPTYNRGHLIIESLTSISAQSFKNWECIIIDDGSTDDTEIILKTFIETDKRFKYIQRSQDHLKGPSGSRNQGIDLAQGEYIIFFDSDDIVHPRNLEICLNVISERNFHFCRYNKSPFWEEFNIPPQPINYKISKFTIAEIDDMVTMKAGFACCTVMWKKSCINDLRFNEKISYAEEWEFYTRLLAQGVSGASIDAVLYYNRKHINSNTGKFWAADPVMKDSKIKAIEEVIDTLKQKGLLSPRIIKYIINWGFFLKNRPIITSVLEKSHSGRYKRLKYYIGFILYPILKPYFRLKSKFKTTD